MARVNSIVLDTDDKFPDLELNLVSGKILKLPNDLGDGYTAVFFYRGYW